MVGKVVRSLLQLLERWQCNIWLVDKMKFGSLEATFGGEGGLCLLNRHVSIKLHSFRIELRLKVPVNNISVMTERKREKKNGIDY